MKAMAQFVLLAMLFTGCKQQKPDPRDVAFLAAGEQAIVGSYTLDNSKLGKETVCTLNVLSNHTFAISNLPAAGSSNVISVSGRWSLTVYHALGVRDARRYRVSFAGVTNIVNVRFPNADLPEGTNPTSLDVWWEEREGQPVSYLFRQTQIAVPTRSGP